MFLNCFLFLSFFVWLFFAANSTSRSPLRRSAGSAPYDIASTPNTLGSTPIGKRSASNIPALFGWGVYPPIWNPIMGTYPPLYGVTPIWGGTPCQNEARESMDTHGILSGRIRGSLITSFTITSTITSSMFMCTISSIIIIIIIIMFIITHRMFSMIISMIMSTTIYIHIYIYIYRYTVLLWMFYAVFAFEPRKAIWCSFRLKISQKCTARHAEYDEQARIRIAC
jgi:hypothetical protein